MIINIEENTTVLDLCLMIEGKLDNIYDFMSKYQIQSLDESLVNRSFDVTFNTNNSLVNSLFISNQKITTGDNQLFNELESYKGEFNSDFSNDFNNIQ